MVIASGMRWTVTTQVAEMFGSLLAVTVMSTLPVLSGETTPLSLTVAMVSSLLLHSTSRAVASAGSNTSSAPRSSVCISGSVAVLGSVRRCTSTTTVAS